ncbi:unnamed protein product [Cochlearia groenlandica]
MSSGLEKKPTTSRILNIRRSQRNRPLSYNQIEDPTLSEEDPVMSEAHGEDSDVEELPPPAFLLRYEEN